MNAGNSLPLPLSEFAAQARTGAVRSATIVGDDKHEMWTSSMWATTSTRREHGAGCLQATPSARDARHKAASVSLRMRVRLLFVYLSSSTSTLIPDESSSIWAA